MTMGDVQFIVLLVLLSLLLAASVISMLQGAKSIRLMRRAAYPIYSVSVGGVTITSPEPIMAIQRGDVTVVREDEIISPPEPERLQQRDYKALLRVAGAARMMRVSTTKDINARQFAYHGLSDALDNLDLVQGGEDAQAE